MKINEINNLRRRIGLFMNYIDEKTIKECWIWKGASADKRYGQFRCGDKRVQAHRFSYLLFNGEIDDDLIVMHTCDNTLCVNPFHLIQGTQQDNIDDMISKDRIGRRGRLRLKENKLKVKRHKSNVRMLNLKQKQEICKLRKEKVKYKTLATKYNVSMATIARVMNGF